jgi:hypothetical protein
MTAMVAFAIMNGDLCLIAMIGQAMYVSLVIDIAPLPVPVSTRTSETA